MRYRFLIIGAGFSGSVLARELVESMDCRVDIWEEREQIAGHCYTSIDEETGIMVHEYGPHIFNTDDKKIWDYFNVFSELRPYTHRVKAAYNGDLYSFPINLSTLNQFFHQTFSPQSASEFIRSLGDLTIGQPDNFEEAALQVIGRKLYDAFFYGYTKKQWGCEPRELPASVFKRLPIRTDYNDNYHKSRFTGIPVNGYTDFVRNLIGHPNISVTLDRKFYPNDSEILGYDHIFYTGPIDAYFNFEFGRLSYRTLKFEREIYEGNYQGCSQINYCDEDVPYTRITEHKYFTPWKKFEKTIIVKEFSSETGPGDIPYYPKRLPQDLERLKRYKEKAETLSKVSFLGRLGTYRYLDMQHVIAEALSYSQTFIQSIVGRACLPVFPNEK